MKGVKPEVWVVHQGDPDNRQEGHTLVLLAATKDAATKHLATYCGVSVDAIEWRPLHRFDDSQEYWVARLQEDEYHLHAQEIES